MPRPAATIPFENDILCEGCGYVLNGLPPGTLCPECAKPASESDPSLRQPPAWERDSSRVLAFLKTTAAVLFTPTRFYRTLATRGEAKPARRFALIHIALAAMFLGFAAYVHCATFIWFGSNPFRLNAFNAAQACFFMIGTYIFIAMVTEIAARLTAWEAAYRSLRLPLPVVRRGLYYHAAHYLPLALGVAITIIGYQMLLRTQRWSGISPVKYLYLLCAEVVIGAIYLFRTYWIAMRNMLFANR